MFIINAPFVFTAAWTMISKWVDPKTRDKIKILGGDYEKELLEYASPESLPNFLKGGKCECEHGCLGTNPGPWNPKDGEIFWRMLESPEEKKKK